MRVEWNRANWERMKQSSQMMVECNRDNFFYTTVSFILQLQCIVTNGYTVCYSDYDYTRIIEIFGIRQLLFLELGM